MPMDLPSTTVPLELRIWTAILVSLLLWLIRAISWLRFIWVVFDIGWAPALVDRCLWLHVNIVAALDEMQRTAQEGVYPVRVIRAALAPYYPDEESRP